VNRVAKPGHLEGNQASATQSFLFLGPEATTRMRPMAKRKKGHSFPPVTRSTSARGYEVAAPGRTETLGTARRGGRHGVCPLRLPDPGRHKLAPRSRRRWPPLPEACSRGVQREGCREAWERAHEGEEPAAGGVEGMVSVVGCSSVPAKRLPGSVGDTEARPES
jgi:hypothetical protein